MSEQGIPLIQFLGDPVAEQFLARNGPGETLEVHRQRLHDPRNPDAEPCCALCCDCGDVEL